MTSITEQITNMLPTGAQIVETCYEGSEIILYTKSKEFFRTCGPLIRTIVDKVKKRIQVRADAKLLLSQEKTAEFIRKNVPKEAGIKDIYFEPEFAKVIIHAEKPGLVIGKAGEQLAGIREKTFWTPEVRRAPTIDSELIRSIRKMLHKEAGYRKKFLHELGQKIYAEKRDIDWIRLTCLGGYREVGRSCSLLQTPQSRILLDCGIALGAMQKPFPYLEAPEFNINALDGVIVSHAHLDHSGLVPWLYAMGYRGPVYCTRPTRDTMTLLQLDYVGICAREGVRTPYTSKDIEEMIKHCVPLEYGEVTDITPDIRLTLENAGHLLGSSTVHLHIGEGLYNILYTSDLKYQPTVLFEPASTTYARVECLIIESTYGTEELPSHREGESFLIQKIKECIARGGRVLVPSFAVGRSQDVIAILTSSDIDCPIYLDGMVWDATAIHTAYPEFLSRTMQTKILHKGENPFTDPRLKGIGSQAERETVLHSASPCVIIATSGMLTGGPALSYLKELAPDPKNMLVFVGYQAEGTIGRRIQKGWKYIPIEGNGRDLELKLEIVTVEGLSGHSDHTELLNFVRTIPTPRKIVVQHGESTTILQFTRELHKEFRVETVAPRVLDAIRLK
jgi:KH/beta-lactamase-domain protein